MSIPTLSVTDSQLYFVRFGQIQLTCLVNEQNYNKLSLFLFGSIGTSVNPSCQKRQRWLD